MAPPPRKSPRANRPEPQTAAASAGAASEVAPLDQLRASATEPTVRRDIIPIPVLIIVFVIVELIIISLMGPKFVKNWTAFNVQRLQHIGEFEAAIPKMHELVKEDPENPTYLAELGNAYLRTKQYQNGIDWYKKAQEKRTNIPADEQGNAPEYPDFNNVIGLGYYNLNDLENAEKYLRLALQHNKLDKLANFLMGEVMFKRGKYKESSEYFKVVASDPGYKERVQDYYARIEKELFKSLK